MKFFSLIFYLHPFWREKDNMNDLIHSVYVRMCLYVTVGIVNKTNRRYGQFKMCPIFIKCDRR